MDLHEMVKKIPGFIYETSSADVSPSTTPCGTPLSGAPKFGTVIPNRIFVGGIAANTTEQELKQFFSAYGAVKDSKIIADRAGVSKGYGFITFENQEDADRIIKKESDNLVFRDRKLNIGPAIRKQQVLPRAFESPVSPGAVMFSNGVPYTYQNGMAVFASPEAGYAVPQAQPQTALMVPQTPPVYLQPQYAAYQVPASAYTSLQTSPQWATTAAAAAATAGQWRYMTQSPTTALTATANPYMIAMQPDLMYAQVPQAYQAPEFTDATVLDGTTGVEGSISLGEQSFQPVSQPIVSATEATVPAPTPSVGAAVVATTLHYPAETHAIQHEKCNPISVINTIVTTSAAVTTSSPVSTITTSKHPSVCPINVAPYKKPITTISRRNFTSPFIVRNGHKVQCLMVPPKNLTSGQYALVAQLPDDTVAPTPPWS
ncbi:protein boule-like isoform X2 [Mercenaria mercenaria]|uniref:protein boule-like isoform X2 n=1 Tax=Mercenaria mercenaria TaxID=6596 RepID=UPI00234F3B63|nr:protein boule-like isoform X2 [Mercenaria mercenaria]